MIEDCGINVKTPLWGSYAILSPEGRETNRKIHQSYFDAGAQIIQTNTHNTLLHNCRKFVDFYDIDFKLLGIDPGNSIEQQSIDLHKYIIRNALEDGYGVSSMGTPIIVANCIGSIDAPYATVGSVTTDDIARIFAVEIQARREISEDLIKFETLTTREEIEGLSIAIRNVNIDNFAIGLSCTTDGRTFGGVSMADVSDKLSRYNPQAYFIQCTRFDLVELALIDLYEAVGDSIPVGVYANDGRGWDVNNMEWVGERVTPSNYAEHAAIWHDAGAKIIGGCCGTTPEHIGELRRVFVSES